MQKIVLLASAMIFFGCQQDVESVGAEPVNTQASAALGDWGVELEHRQVETHPGDDFFRHASGRWLDQYELPDDKTRFGAFNALRDLAQERVRDLVAELAATQPAAGTIEQKIGDYYRSYLDVTAIEAQGLAPIQSELDAIAAIEERIALTRMFGQSELVATNSPIRFGIEIDRLNPDRFIAGVSHSGLGLPDRDYYLEESPRFVEIRSQYVTHIGRMLSVVDFPGAELAAADVLALEIKIAEAQWPRAKRRNRDLTYNLQPVAEIITDYPGFAWQEFLAAVGANPSELNIRHPSAIRDLIPLINETPIDSWKAYLTFHLVTGNARLLTQEIDEANFDFYGRTLRGQKTQRERWRRAVSLVSGNESLGDAIGELYVARYFPAESKSQMLSLVANLQAALRNRISALEWMSEETKTQAYLKLEGFRPKIGYPDKWRDFSSVTIDPADLAGNVKRLRGYFYDDTLNRLNQATDKAEWFSTAQTVNAFYNPQFNAITFPAGILQPPFFDPHADPAVNYGAIGAIIGHEMGHGFDDQGSKSDAAGVQRNWWTKEDRQRFEIRAERLAQQYSGYEPIQGTFIDGSFTLGENIGDLGGVNVAYHAYQLSLQGVPAPVIDGLTGEQRFFLAYAQVWRSKMREESLLARLKSDPHSPAEFRVNGVVRNVDAWYEAFEVTPEHDLYLTPQERVAIW